MLHPSPCWLLLALLLPAPLWAGSFNRVPSPPKATATPVAPPAAPAPAPEQPAGESAATEAGEPEAAVQGASAGSAEETPAAPESDGLAEPVGEPTYGEVCIFGPRGVVHAPQGRDCEAEQAAKTAAAAALASSGSGRCIFGRGGKVVYAPPGEQCEGRVREVAPKPPERRLRRRSIYD